MKKQKIMLIPLDERPCNLEFPVLMAKETDFEVITPPKNILSNKKIPGDVEAIFEWAKQNIADCQGAIISIDTLVYSSIVSSRLHDYSTQELMERIDRLYDLKVLNPDIKLLAYNLIMRNPKYSSSDEEPDYYGEVGYEIHRYGVITHRLELGIATEDEKNELDNILTMINPEYLNDYLDRRRKNIEINKRAIELTRDNVIDFLIIPQDDASPYGLTAKDQQLIREQIRQTKQQLNVYMYPDADAVCNTLLARYINQANATRPLIYVKYASALGDTIIPLYEDRTVSETIKYQILAAGGLVASSASEADIILMVNTPSGNPQEHMISFDSVVALPAMIEYDACRNMIEQVEYAEHAISILGKRVVFADVAYANGGDPALFELLKLKGLLYKISGYAGWNTSSNTLGTCIPCGMIHNIYGDRQSHFDFLALRYVEDIGYMCFVKKTVTANHLSNIGYDYFHVDGQRGTVSEIVWQELATITDSYINGEKHHITIHDCYMPWDRMFEVGLSVSVKIDK